MVSVKQCAAFWAACILSFAFTGRSAVSSDRPDDIERPANSLFAQSAAQLFAREFDGPDISYLLLDAHSGALVASRWDNADRPIAMGSLVKPFTAFAYGSQHNFRYPEHICKGEASGCWRPAGHGATNITAAIANSCNSYFRMLTSGMTGRDLDATAQEFGLDQPGDRLHDAALTGLGGEWRVAPIHMARAYLELSRRRNQPGAAVIVGGMAQSAETGTGQELGRAVHSRVLVKTGTAPCTHRRHAPGDGFVVVLFPAQEPEFLLLVRAHGVPGAQAAVTAGQMVRRLEE
jgi:cell division protein FtsI/penicillin-binding protein 2